MPRSSKIVLTEAQRDYASILEALPADDVPLLLLICLYYLGYGVRCYQPAGLLGQWVVWIDRLAEVRPDHDGRVSVGEWTRNYPAILAELGYHASAEPVPAEGEGDVCTEC